MRDQVVRTHGLHSPFEFQQIQALLCVFLSMCVFFILNVPFLPYEDSPNVTAVRYPLLGVYLGLFVIGVPIYL